MNLPDWREMALEAGVLREPASDGGRIVLWLPRERDGAFQHWERIGTVARAEVSEEQGLCATAAALIPARQRVKGVLGKLLGRLQEAKGSRAFVLPNGESAEPSGERATDLLIVWSADDADTLDESRIQSRWPEARRYQRLGPKLFLVGGLGAKDAPATVPQPLPPSDGCPRAFAEQLLTGRAQAATAPKKSRR